MGQMFKKKAKPVRIVQQVSSISLNQVKDFIKDKYLKINDSSESTSGSLQIISGISSNYSVDTTKYLGHGHYSSVIKGHSDKKIFAIKKINEYHIKIFQNEIDILRKIRDHGQRHPNIINYYESFEHLNYYYIVFEFIDGHELFHEIVKNGKNGSFKENGPMTKIYINQLGSAIKWLHQQNIVHRDLKLENIMLSNKDRSLKIVDFGLSKIIKNKYEKMDTVCGTPCYFAPELLIKPIEYTRKVDMWSFGIIIYIMIAGYHPFDPFGNNTNQQIYEEILKFKSFDNFEDFNKDFYNNDLKDLLKKLIINEENRLDSDEVLNHKWLSIDILNLC